MSSEILAQIRLFVFSLFTGVGLMALYDILRIFRMLVHHGWFWVGMEDVLYWIAAGFCTFVLLYRENNGELRFYAVAAVFVSMVIYDRAFSRFFLKWLKKAAGCFRMKRKGNRR